MARSSASTSSCGNSPRLAELRAGVDQEIRRETGSTAAFGSQTQPISKRSSYGQRYLSRNPPKRVALHQPPRQYMPAGPHRAYDKVGSPNAKLALERAGRVGRPANFLEVAPKKKPTKITGIRGKGISAAAAAACSRRAHDSVSENISDGHPKDCDQKSQPALSIRPASATPAPKVQSCFWSLLTVCLYRRHGGRQNHVMTAIAGSPNGRPCTGHKAPPNVKGHRQQQQPNEKAEWLLDSTGRLLAIGVLLFTHRKAKSGRCVDRAPAIT